MVPMKQGEELAVGSCWKRSLLLVSVGNLSPAVAPESRTSGAVCPRKAVTAHAGSQRPDSLDTVAKRDDASGIEPQPQISDRAVFS